MTDIGGRPPPRAGRRTIQITGTDQAIQQAPVIYVDGAQGLAANDQFVKFNLYQDRLTGEEPNPIQRVVCARLVMSPQVFRELANWLSTQTTQILGPAGS